MIKALIFDFDGLIMDTESPEVEAWQAVYARYGQVFPLEEWIDKVVGSYVENLDPGARLAELTGEPVDGQALKREVRSMRLAKHAMLPALPGVRDYIQEARRLGLRLAIASSSPHAWVEGYLRQLGLLEYFEMVICREDVLEVKPAPDLFLRALAVLEVLPEQALVFEDSFNGVLAAKRAKIRVVAVPNPITARGSMGQPDLQLHSLADIKLEKLLERFNSDIRPETTADISAVREVETAAFGRATEADLVDLCREHGKVSLSLVLEKEGRLVAHVLFTPVRLDPAAPGWLGLGLGPVAVLPEFQRQGLGSRLVEAGLETCRSLGIDYVVLLGDPHYYCRFGFIPASEFGLGNEYGAGEAFMARELRPGVLRGARAVVKYVDEFNEVGD